VGFSADTSFFLNIFPKKIPKPTTLAAAKAEKFIHQKKLKPTQ
jgi:hypothetical protein